MPPHMLRQVEFIIKQELQLLKAQRNHAGRSCWLDPVLTSRLEFIWKIFWFSNWALAQQLFQLGSPSSQILEVPFVLEQSPIRRPSSTGDVLSCHLTVMESLSSNSMLSPLHREVLQWLAYISLQCRPIVSCPVASGCKEQYLHLLCHNHLQIWRALLGLSSDFSWPTDFFQAILTGSVF